ncbi:MAG TPA: hypothetical protein VMV99_09920 [Rhodanobacter sp.]|nr:hypothetical protein [Rhodanobacter sp.]
MTACSDKADAIGVTDGIRQGIAGYTPFVIPAKSLEPMPSWIDELSGAGFRRDDGLFEAFLDEEDHGCTNMQDGFSTL